MAPLTTHHLHPPFPSNVPTASLLSISLQKLQSSPPSQEESSRMFAACRDLGFFYLDLTNSELGKKIITEIEELHTLQQQFYALPHEIKDQYGQHKVDPFFSYRYNDSPDGVKDVYSRPGRREMYNLRVDDLFNIRPHLPRHEIISAAEPTLLSFATHCREVVHLLLSILETNLQLPSGTLLSLHKNDQARGDFISLQHRASEPYSSRLVTAGEHTDFGTITLLANWLGGLQIRDQSDAEGKAGEWVYVKPIPGSFVVNLADSLVKLTAGILKSNIHRVAPAPPPQDGLPRYSLVYFSHPNDDVDLTPVKGGLVDAAVREADAEDEIINAADWVTRRSLGDLRGVYTYKGGIELRENNDAVAASDFVKVKA